MQKFFFFFLIMLVRNILSNQVLGLLDTCVQVFLLLPAFLCQPPPTSAYNASLKLSHTLIVQNQGD